jgi:hypothetical protein
MDEAMPGMEKGTGMIGVEENFTDVRLDTPGLDAGHGVVLERRANGEEYTTACTNVPHLCTQHSPSGFEWGYAGSGPADLALNIVEWYLRTRGFTGGRMFCWRGQCFTLAWRLHQEFKFTFLANMPKSGGRISYAEIDRFVRDREVEGYL